MTMKQLTEETLKIRKEGDQLEKEMAKRKEQADQLAKDPGMGHVFAKGVKDAIRG